MSFPTHWKERYSWVPVGLLAVIPLFYAIPLIGIGLDDYHAVRHLDHGEFTILRVWKGVYPNGPLYAPPFDMEDIYPKAFYNVAGLILYPYGYLWGENFRMVLIVWRSLNAVMAMGAVIVLFLLLKRVFHSRTTAFLGTGLFAITPEFLVWSVNSRPNPMEQLLLFAALFFCVRLIEQFSYRVFLLAALTSAVAFSTKYGALPLLVLVPGVALYSIWRAKSAPFASTVREQLQVLRVLSLPLLVAIALILGGALWLWQRNDWNVIGLYMAVSGAVFPAEYFPKVIKHLTERELLVNALAWGLVGGLIGVAAVILLFRRWAAMLRPDQQSVRPYLFLLGMFLVQTFGIVAVVFVLCSPSYVTHPEHFLSQFGWLIYYIGLGGSWGHQPVPGVLEILRMTLREAPGWWLLCPLIVYALLLQIKESHSLRMVPDGRMVLWAYVVLSLIIFLMMPNPSFRHILPPIAILYGLVAYAVVATFRQALRQDWGQKGLATTLGLVMVGYVMLNLSVAFAQWTDKRQKPQDAGLQVGSWIREHYGACTSILTDSWIFYTPMEFKNVSTTEFLQGKGISTQDNEQLIRDHLVAFDPEIVIVTDLKGEDPRPIKVEPLLLEDPLLKLRGYHLVKQAESRRPDEWFGNIRVYARPDSHDNCLQ